MNKFETTQFDNSIATLNRAGATSVIERSIVNGRSKMTAGRQGGFEAASSTISNCTAHNSVTLSTTYFGEVQSANSTGLNTSRIINRGEAFATNEGNVQMDNCFFVTARSGGFQVNTQNIRGIADQADRTEAGSWKISSRQTGAVRKAA